MDEERSVIKRWRQIAPIVASPRRSPSPSLIGSQLIETDEYSADEI